MQGPKGHGNKISRKQEQAIAALLVEATIRDAAASVGVSEATLWRWMQRADFRSAYRAARRQVVEHAVAHLQRATADAVAGLARNLTCGVPSVEVRSAGAILSWAVRGVELMDLEERVVALEGDHALTSP